MLRKYKLLIPALVLVVLSAWTFINSGTNYSLTTQQYCGLAAAVICVGSFFLFKKYYKYILGATLLLGLINLLNFTPAETTTFLKFKHVSIISFQPYALFVIILTVVSALPKKSEVKIIQSENVSKFNQEQFKEDLEKFKKLYNTQASADLSEIIESGKFTAAAKEAAKQILSTRKTEEGST